MKVVFVGAGPVIRDCSQSRRGISWRSAAFIIYAGSLVSPDVMSLVPACAERLDLRHEPRRDHRGLWKGARSRYRCGTSPLGRSFIYGAIREQMNELDGLGFPTSSFPA